MTGYELIIHPMVEVANNLIHDIRTEIGIPESILPDKMIKDDVMASFRVFNCKYFSQYFFGDTKEEEEPE